MLTKFRSQNWPGKIEPGRNESQKKTMLLGKKSAIFDGVKPLISESNFAVRHTLK